MNSPVSKFEPHMPALVIAKDLVFSISDGETCSFALQMTCDEAHEVAELLHQLAADREGLASCQCVGSA